MDIPILWVAQTTDRKTGPITVGYIGESREQSFSTCRGCPLLKPEHGGTWKSGPMCNHQYSTPGLAHTSLIRAHRSGKDRTLATALKRRLSMARYVRILLGDPARLKERQLREVKDAADAEGLGVLSYTHFWREASRTSTKGRLLRELCMASCHTLEEADEAIELGWSATVIVPHDDDDGAPRTTPAGNRAIMCPATATKSAPQPVTCNACGKCDPRQSRGEVILFKDTGPNVPAAARKR